MPKPFTSTSNGFQLAFENGWTISVQWGYGNYCTNHNKGRDFSPDFIESNTAEIAIWPTEYRGRLTNTWFSFDGDKVLGCGWIHKTENKNIQYHLNDVSAHHTQ